MNLKLLTIVAGFLAVTGCTFFDEPLDEFSTAPGLPAPGSNTTAPLPEVSSANTDSAPKADQTPTADTSTLEGNAEGTYFTVVTLFDMPENANNISFVHFTSSPTNRDTRRELGLCKALLETYPVTKPADVPANAEHLIVWPVRSETSGANCIEMLTDYEPIDISNETARKIKNNADGPFMLSRNTPSKKRLIYDLSFVRPKALSKALGEWQLVINNTPQDWPAYQSAR